MLSSEQAFSDGGRSCDATATIFGIAFMVFRHSIAITISPYRNAACSETLVLHLQPMKQHPEGWNAMLTNTKELKGLVVRATDGELGTVDDFYFDDQTWAIRYLTVETGSWMKSREVLISPFSITDIEWQASQLHVTLTKKQVVDSPDIDIHKPISRQHEASYLDYYGYPYYWAGPYLWGPASYPMDFGGPGMKTSGASRESIPTQAQDAHLRSIYAVNGYRIHAIDGQIGHVDGFLVDDKAWAIRYIEAATQNWWPGKRVLVSPAWIERISWSDSEVFVGLSRETIQAGPEYCESSQITREFEERLHQYYGQPPYWINPAQRESSQAIVSL